MDYGVAIGAFAVSWAEGYLAFFAPGSIGMREVLLTTLSSCTPLAASLIVIAGVHRLTWTVTDLLYGLVFVFYESRSDIKEAVSLTASFFF